MAWYLLKQRQLYLCCLMLFCFPHLFSFTMYAVRPCSNRWFSCNRPWCSSVGLWLLLFDSELAICAPVSDFPFATAVAEAAGGGDAAAAPPVGVAALVRVSDSCGEAGTSAAVGVGKLAGGGDVPPRITWRSQFCSIAGSTVASRDKDPHRCSKLPSPGVFSATGKFQHIHVTI